MTTSDHHQTKLTRTLIHGQNWSGYRPITFTRLFKPRRNILSYVRANVRKYIVTWLEHPRESNRPVLGPLLAELIFGIHTRTAFVISLQWPRDKWSKKTSELINQAAQNLFYLNMFVLID